MLELLKITEILKIGATSKNYPPYGQYMVSESGILQTNNDNVFVNIEFDLPFNGGVNIFVLNDLLKKLDQDKPFHLSSEGNILTIESGNSKTDLNIHPIKIPQPKVGIPEKLVDISIASILRHASKFAGSGSYGYVFIDNNAVIAYDSKRFFVADIIETGVKLGLGKSALSLINDDCSIGEKDGIVHIQMNEADYAKFSEYVKFDEVPTNKIKAIVKNTFVDSKSICEVKALKEAADLLSPVFFGERSHFITLKSGDALMVSASSAVNGESQVKLVADNNLEFTINLGVELLKTIPDSYRMYYSPKFPDRVLFLFEQCSIVMMAMQ